MPSSHGPRPSHCSPVTCYGRSISSLCAVCSAHQRSFVRSDSVSCGWPPQELSRSFRGTIYPISGYGGAATSTWTFILSHSACLLSTAYYFSAPQLSVSSREIYGKSCVGEYETRQYMSQKKRRGVSHRRRVWEMVCCH